MGVLAGVIGVDIWVVGVWLWVVKWNDGVFLYWVELHGWAVCESNRGKFERQGGF